MGNFAPVLFAFILNLAGVNIFRETKDPGMEPLISSVIFLTAVFILLLDIRLYPGSLRKLWRCGSAFIQFVIASFLIELIMNDFWWPLEASFFALLPKIADFEKEVLRQSGLDNIGGVLQVLRLDIAAIVVSYLLSIFFFLCALHATRIIDLRLLRSCPGVFFKEMGMKLNRLRKRFMRSVGLRKKKVNFGKKCYTRADFEDEFFNQPRLQRTLPARGRSFNYLD